MEFTGIITRVLPMESGVSEKGREWKSREFVVEEEFAEFPQTLGCRVRGDNAESALLVTGNRVKVSFSTRTRVFCDKSNRERVATEINVWNIETVM